MRKWKKWLSILLILALAIQSLSGYSIDTAKAEEKAAHVHTAACYSVHNHAALGCKKHAHVGSESTGGGCYGTPVYHQHTAACPKHVHKGNTSTGGECYRTPVKHVHTAACPKHKHTGSSSAGGGCYTKAVKHVHSANCYKNLPNFTEARVHTNRYPIWDYSISFSANGIDGNGAGITFYDTSFNKGVVGFSVHYSGGLISTNKPSSVSNFYSDGASFNDDMRNLCVLYAGNIGTIDFKGSAAVIELLEVIKTKYPNYYNYIMTDIETYLCNYQQIDGKYYRPDLISTLVCGKTTDTIERYDLGCGKTPETLECGKTTETVDYYDLSCNKTTDTYECGKTTATIEKYKLNCGKTAGAYECGVVEETATQHLCQGNTTAGGACYQTPVYHQHTAACPKHVHSGNTTSGGTCYSPVYHAHGNACGAYQAAKYDTVTGYFMKECYGTYIDGDEDYELNYGLTLNFPCGAKLYFGYQSTIKYSSPSRHDYNIFVNISHNGITDSHRQLYSAYKTSSGSEPIKSFKKSLVDFASTKGYSLGGKGSFPSGRPYYSKDMDFTWTEIKSTFSAYLSEISNWDAFLCDYQKCTSAKETYYTCGKTTSTIEKYELTCSKTGQYECGKTTNTIVGYEQSCGKINGKYYTAEGKEASPMCDVVVTNIVPKTINVPYGQPHVQATATATYLDGHTGTVNVSTNYNHSTAVVGTKSYTATYTGRVNTAAGGISKIEKLITVNTIGAQAFALANKKQIIYKGQELNLKGTANYGDAGTLEDVATSTNLDTSILGREQTVTVTYDSGNKVTDTMQVIVLPNPTQVSAADVETTKGTDKDVTFKVGYEDGTSRDLTFKLSELNKTYTDSYSLGDVTTNLTAEWINQNTDETGINYQTGGAYTLKLNYQGIDASTNVSVIDSCSVNTNHKDFKHDTCPVCNYINKNTTEYDSMMQSITSTKGTINANISAMNDYTFAAPEDVIDRDKDSLKKLNTRWNEIKEIFKGYLTEYSDSLAEFKNGWATAATPEEALSVFDCVTELYNEGSRDIVELWNEAIKLQADSELLADHKDAINKFTPEITITTETTKIYDGNAIPIGAEATVEEFDKDFVNKVKFYIEEDGEWVELGSRTLSHAGVYSMRAVTQDTDYLIGEKLFTITIEPRELTYTYGKNSKVYDGTKDITLSVTLEGILNKDVVEAKDCPAAFEYPNAGEGIVVTPNKDIVLTGKNASDYKVTTAPTTGTITKAPLKVTTKEVSSEYGDIPEFEFVWDGFVAEENQDTIYDDISIKASVKSTKVGKQKVEIDVTAENINYEIIPTNGKIEFTAPKGYEKLEFPLVSDGNIFIINGNEKWLDYPFEIWHPTDKSTIIEHEGNQWVIKGNGTLVTILDGSKGDITITGDVVSQGDTTFELGGGGIQIEGSGNSNIIIGNYAGEIYLKDYTGKDLTVIDDSKVKVVISGDNSLDSITVENGSSLTIEGDGNLIIHGGLTASGGSDLTIKNEGNTILDGGNVSSKEDSKIDVSIDGDSSISGITSDKDSSITIKGEGNLSVGDINNSNNSDVTIDAGGRVDIGGDLTTGTGSDTSINAGTDITVGGSTDVTGDSTLDLDAGGKVDLIGGITVDDNSKTDIDAGKDSSIEDGGVHIGGDTTDVTNDSTLDIDSGSGNTVIDGNLNIDGGSTGNITGGGDISIGGNVNIDNGSNGNITAGGNVTTGGDTTVDNDSKLDIGAGDNVNLEGNTSVNNGSNLDIDSDKDEDGKGDIIINGGIDTDHNSGIDLDSGKGNTDINGDINIDNGSDGSISGGGNLDVNGDINVGNGSHLDTDADGSTNIKGDIDISGGSNADLDFGGNSSVDNIFVDKDSDVVIGGNGSLDVPGGIGGRPDSPSGDITINGGDINSGYIGNHPEYVPEEGEKLPDVIIDGGIVNSPSISPVPIDKEGNTLKFIEVQLGKEKGNVFYYTRDDNPDGVFYQADKREESIKVLIHENAKKIYVTNGTDNYYVYVTREPYRLIPIRTGGSSGGGGSFGSSSGGTTSKSTDIIIRENNQSKEQAIHGISNSYNISVSGKADKGLVYINAKELHAKDGYLLSNTVGGWKPSIATGKVGVYDNYQLFMYNISARSIKYIGFHKTCVDYVKPKAKFTSSDKGIKLNKDSKNKYNISTNDKQLTFKVNADFGVSGKKAMKYQFVKKDKKVSSKGWKTIKGSTIKRTPGSYEVLYVKYYDKAGNVTTLKTYGYQSDKDKPKINLKNKKSYKKNTKLKATDKKSGVKKITVNGKTVKNGYVFKKKGNYKIVVTDKAGNISKITIKIK